MKLRLSLCLWQPPVVQRWLLRSIPPDRRLLIDTDFESCLYFVIERDANFDIEADAMFIPGEYVSVCVDHIDHWTKIANALAHYGVDLPEPWGR